MSPVQPPANKTIIHCLDAQFARHGLPRGLRTDNGSNVVSKEVEEYLKEMGIEHRYTTPLSFGQGLTVKWKVKIGRF